MNRLPSAKEFALSPFLFWKRTCETNRYSSTQLNYYCCCLYKKDLYRILAKAVHDHRIKSTDHRTENP